MVLLLLLFSGFLLTPSVSHALIQTKVPVFGTDTSDNKFDVSNVQTSDNTRDAYAAPGSYDESKYQEYAFDLKLCPSATITSVAITVEWMVRRIPNAKIEVYDRNGAYLNYNLSAGSGTNGEVTDIIYATNVTSWEDVNKLKVRFLASGNASPQIDHVYATVTYSDAGLCISPDYTEFKFPGTISYAHRISNGTGAPVNAGLSAVSSNSWTTRIYRDSNMDGVNDNSTIINSVSVPANGFTGIVVEIDMPAGFSGDDTTTVTATGPNIATAKDATATPVDGVKEAEYSAPYASYRFFDYGPDPNMASGELYSYVKNDVMHIYYAQNPRNVNDNTYGANSQEGWAGGHTLDELLLSDKTEFIFLDESGNIKLSFFSDYVGSVTPSPQYPSGYHSHGFVKGLNNADGEILVNATGKTDADLSGLISIESSAAYNLNHFYNAAAGSPQVVCTNRTVNLLNDSPDMDLRYYTIDTLCPNAADYQMAYAIEMAIPIAKIFPNEPVIDIVARAHNSPSKTDCRDCPPIVAEASIGDYVWYDWNGDGIQDAWENGIPNVRVVLYWDRNGNGVFSENERLIETRTDGNGYYLFKKLFGGSFVNNLGQTIYSGDYKVVIDETTIPGGFTPTTPRTANPNFYVLASNPLIAAPDRPTLGLTEDCRSADFGYKPLGNMIGDFIWADCNDNGIQNNGELGVAGVEVELECVSLTPPVNPSLPFSCPGVIATSTTTAEGRYYFTGYSFSPAIPDGLPAGTYRVRVTAGNFDPGGPLDGYELTTGPDTQPGLTSNDIVLPPYDPNDPTQGIFLGADFGFFLTSGACGTIGNAVYFNADCTPFGAEDPTPFTGGDFGFANVTLSIWMDDNNNGLRDDSDSYLGSTTTDSNGEYLFTGLPISATGVGYIIQVTDNNNVLTGFEKWYPRAGLTATLTTAAREDLTVDFPYVAFGTIGDFIWNDLDRDGIQDTGEPGIPGVTVQLEFLDGSWSVHSSTMTDSQGKYTFSGLRTTQPDGSPTQYRVSVTDTAGVLSGWTASPQSQGGDTSKDSNNPSGSTTSLGGSTCTSQNDLTIDFGYYNPNLTFGCVGDYIWHDSNGDQQQNDSCVDADNNPVDCGFNGVTLELRDAATDNLISTTATATYNGYAGWYKFEGLTVASGGSSYKVVVTDINGKLAGYTMTTDPAVLNVTLTPASSCNLTADAGYKKIPTAVQIASFSAHDQNGRVVLSWETSSETNTVGFYLLRLDETTGQYNKVHRDLLPALVDSHQGGVYSVIDDGARSGGTYTYKITEVESKGARISYGPFTVAAEAGDGTTSMPADSTSSASPHQVSAEKKARIAARKEAKETEKQSRESKKGNLIKLAVTEDGIYHLTGEEIALVMDLPATRMQYLIKNRSFALSNMGREIAYIPDSSNSGILFYGQKPDSLFTKENIYWLSSGRGLSMDTAATEYMRPGIPVRSAESFTEALHIEEDQFDTAGMFSDPEADYWFWSYIFGGFAGMDTASLPFRVDAVAGTSSQATITVNLHGGSDTESNPDHHVVVSLNGTKIAEGSWDGATSYSIETTFSQGLLLEGDNTLQIQGLLDPGVPYSLVMVDSFDLKYERLYKAVDEMLAFQGGSSPVSVTGFLSPDISVFEITDPERPKVVTSASIDKADEAFSVSFTPSSVGSRYLALSSAALRGVNETWPSVTADLGKTNAVDYLIITAGELADASQSLANYRANQGLKTKVVSLESIFDKFSFGIYTPEAIKAFLSYAYYNWKKAPRYVVLVGEGTYDYRDIYGFGDNLIPAAMVGTPFGLFPSDNYFADADGNYMPEVAVGRLPVATADELRDVVTKIIAYENSGGGTWQNKVLMAADKPDAEAGDFPLDSNMLISLLPSGYSVEHIYLSENSLSVARQMLLDRLNSGAQLLNYIGHGSVDRMANDGLMLSSDVNFLNNGPKLPVVTAQTCFINNFGSPGYDSLGEVLMMKKDGGASAVWGPTGLSLNSQAVMLGKGLFRAVFQNNEQILGRAVLRALDEYSKNGSEPFMLDIYVLIGDPALRIR
jgi:hypothetical protein